MKLDSDLYVVHLEKHDGEQLAIVLSLVEKRPW